MPEKSISLTTDTMKIRKFITLLAFATVLIFTVESCRSGRSSVGSGGMSESAVSGVLTVKEARRQLSQTIESYGRWQTVKLPVTIRLREPKSLTISGTATMERNRSLAISLRFLGMEVGSLSINSDTITVIDRINKAYFKDDVTALLDGFPATVGNLQDLLLGRVFVPGERIARASDFDVALSDTPELWTASGELHDYNLRYSYAFRGADALKALAVRIADKSPVTFAYSDFYSSTAGAFANSVSIEAMGGSTPVEATIEWNFKKAVWNAAEGVQDKSKVPSGYSRITPEAVMKMLKNL